MKTKARILGILVVIFGVTSIYNTQNNSFEVSKNIEIFSNVFRDVNTYFVDEVDPDALMQVGVDAMLQSLDPYTRYIDASEMSDFRYTTTGKYGGVGSIIRVHGDYVVVAEVYKDFPAFNAGLRAGDKIIKVGEQSTKGMTTKQVSALLKGEPGTDAQITITRPIKKGETTLDVTLTRSEIQVNNVPYSGIAKDNIGYIKLTTFTEKSGRNVKAALEQLKENNPNLSGVILDLRGNGGGLLTEAINVSNVFIPKGEVVVKTKGKVKKWDRSFKTLNGATDTDIPLVVLIDGRSASASEIVSGVIQDSDRGILIGQKTYGKGLVQNTRDVGYSSKVKLTTAKYYIPSGRCIQSVNYEDGKAVEIDEEDRAIYFTKNKRKVYDGGGVSPDLKLDALKTTGLVRSLLRNNHIFDFAVDYRIKNGEVSNPASFTLSDPDFNSFVSFVQGKEYDYETDSERVLKKLIEEAENEDYYSGIKSEIDDLKAAISADKSSDMMKHRERIKDLISREIVVQSSHQQGRIQHSIKNDAEVIEAVNLLQSPTEYFKVLAGN